MKRAIFYAISFLLINSFVTFAVESPDGFRGAKWGGGPNEVVALVNVSNWRQVQGEDSGFPKNLNITLYSAESEIAGYSANLVFYFFSGKFFQATVKFPFDDLNNFDFNYNVFISVDRYYRAIHDKTLVFVLDIYDLLQKKYGKKQPVFKGLDPRYIFHATDAYIRQELWNLRYHPSEYYKRIVASAYAIWDYPKTRITFSINISASDNRFDYHLSATSRDLEKEINSLKDELRMNGL